jgi:hypothetical protein
MHATCPSDLILLVRFEVLAEVRMILFFWAVILYTLVGRYQQFGKTYCLHLQGCSGNAGKWIYLFIVYLTMLSVSWTIQCQMIGW